MRRDHVVQVDQEDNAVGTVEKMEAHRLGVLHRAFSVFIWNSDGQLLIHQRAADKYHGGGLWTNACCSHPQANENVRDAAMERLSFEMGLACDVNFAFSFIYQGAVERGLIEHEFDHVFIGHTDEQPKPNCAEVAAYQWIAVSELADWVARSPEAFTIWFVEALPRVLSMMPADIRA